MSNTDQILTVSLEAKINKLEREMRKATGTVGRNFDQIERRSKLAATRLESNMAKAASGVSRAFSAGMIGMTAGAGVGLSAGAMVQLASKWKDLQSQVNNAAGSMSRGTEVMGRLTE